MNTHDMTPTARDNAYRADFWETFAQAASTAVLFLCLTVGLVWGFV